MSKEHSKCSSGCSHGHYDHTHHQGCDHHEHDHHHEDHWLKATLGLGFGVSLLILSLAGIALSMPWMLALTFSSTALTFYLGFNTYKSAFQALSKGQWNHATLYTISTLTLVTLSILGLFIPGLVALGESAPVVLGFWHLGEAIEHSLVDKLQKKLDIRDCLPKQVKRNGELVSVEDLKPSDVIEIEPGMVLPVDGIVMTSTYLQTSRVDGSPNSKSFNMGDLVKSGMQLPENGTVMQLWVSKPYAESHLSLEAKRIQQGHREKAPIEVLTGKILKYFIPTILGIAILSGGLIASFFSPLLAVQCATAVLVSACPCVLSLIIPMVVKIAMQKASEMGVRIKDGKAIQAAGEVKHVVCDMHGTLTDGVSKITQCSFSDERYAAHLALLESHAKHSFGVEINRYLTKHYKPNLSQLKLEKLNTSNHSGLKAKINGETFLVGDENMLAAHGMKSLLLDLPEAEHNQIYFVKDGALIGQIEIQDKLRPDAISMARALGEQGIYLHIATGGSLSAAKQVATKLGIPHTRIYANSSEEKRSKADYIKFWQDKGDKVCMIGDAANDAPAIARANLGIAVKSPISDGITEQEAGIVLSQGALFPIAQTFELAKKANRTAFVTLGVSLGYNTSITLLASGLFLASGLIISPVIGVALAMLESVIVLGMLFAFKASSVQTEEEFTKAQSSPSSSFFGFFSSGHTESMSFDASGYLAPCL